MATRADARCGTPQPDAWSLAVQGQVVLSDRATTAAADCDRQTCRSGSTPAIVIESDEVQAWLVALLVLGCTAQGRLPRICASPAGQLGECGTGPGSAWLHSVLTSQHSS